MTGTLVLRYLPSMPSLVHLQVPVSRFAWIFYPRLSWLKPEALQHNRVPMRRVPEINRAAKIPIKHFTLYKID